MVIPLPGDVLGLRGELCAKTFMGPQWWRMQMVVVGVTVGKGAPGGVESWMVFSMRKTL